MDYASTLKRLTDILIPRFSSDAKFEAQTLLSYYLNIPMVSPSHQSKLRFLPEQILELESYAHRRATGEPVQYILGSCEFLGLRLKVGPGVLIPRLDSEAMVLNGVKHLSALNKPTPRILDLGAGSGALGLAVMSRFKNAQLVAIEISSEAQGYLRQNIESLGVKEKVEIGSLDLDDVNRVQEWKRSVGSFDLILANPPYIDRADPDLDTAVKSFEPSLALFAEDRGLEKIFSWSQNVMDLLSSDGIYVCEMGWKQGQAISEWYLTSSLTNFDFTIHKDLSGKDRFFQLKRRNDKM